MEGVAEKPVSARAVAITILCAFGFLCSPGVCYELGWFRLGDVCLWMIVFFCAILPTFQTLWWMAKIAFKVLVWVVGLLMMLDSSGSRYTRLPEP